MLTLTGEQLVARWGSQFEERFASLVEAAGVPYRTYLSHTERLLGALDTQPARSQGR
jgi:hypothetical protein